MKHLPKDFLSIGRGAEYVIFSDDSVILVSAGRQTVISTELTSKTESSLVLRDPQDGWDGTVIFKGTAAETMKAFLDVSSRLRKSRGKGILDTVRSLSVSVAAVAIVAALAVFFVETRQIAAELTSQSAVGMPGTGPGAAQDLSSLGLGPAGLQVLKRPDFLQTDTAGVPPGAGEETGDGREVTEVAESARRADPANGRTAATGKTEPAPAASTDIAATVAALNLPSFTPDLYVHPEKPVTASPPSSEIDVDKTAKPEVPAKPVASGRAADAIPLDSKPPAIDPEHKAPSTDATAKGAPEKAPDQKTSAAAPSHDPALEKNAQAAVSKLIGDGMSQDQIRKLLMDLQQLNAGGADGLTPDMLKALPEEVAALLADQGMELQGPSSGTMNILPSEVVDSFRGKDGVATIPENHSWYARSGGPISIPLPGGGDVKTPEDLVDFGLQP